MVRFKSRENFFIILGLIVGLFVSLFLINTSVLLREGLHLFTGNIIREVHLKSISEKCFPHYDNEYNVEFYFCKNLSQKEIEFLFQHSAQIKKMEESVYLVSFRDRVEKWK